MLISQGEDEFISLNDPRNEYIVLYNSPEFHSRYTLLFKTFVVEDYYYWVYARSGLVISEESLANHP